MSKLSGTAELGGRGADRASFSNERLHDAEFTLARPAEIPNCTAADVPSGIVYFGNDWSAENRTSSHQIARCLAKQFPVLYVECPGLRAPNGSARDFKKIAKKLWLFLRGGRKTPEGVVVQTLLQIPLHRFACIRWFNALLIRLTLRWVIWRRGMKQPLAWYMVPHLASVVGTLGESLSVYYCIDDYASLPDVDRAAVEAMDAELTKKADLVFVASETLLDRKRQLNPRTYVSPHGVDLEHFQRAGNADGAVPADAKNLPKPIIGFFGLIETWIDLDLIDYLAEQRPHWTFLMIGRVAVPDHQVPRRPNIHFLGRKPYAELPDYGRIFDVAVIPYRMTQQVFHANPIKLREYLAMGKPVVSVSTPEIDKYGDVVNISHSHDEFLEKLDSVVQRAGSPDASQRRIERVSSEGWDARVDCVLAKVNESLAAGKLITR